MAVGCESEKAGLSVPRLADLSLVRLSGLISSLAHLLSWIRASSRAVSYGKLNGMGKALKSAAVDLNLTS